MEQVIVVCGVWKLENNRWLFYSDKKGTKVLPVNEKTSFEDFEDMVYEDYGLQRRLHVVKLSYMLPKSLTKSTVDTPPVRVDNLRQFIGFLHLFKSDKLRLCVEVNDKGSGSTNPTCNETHTSSSPLKAENEESDDEGERFDCYEDSDGVTSDDEDFTKLGLVAEEIVQNDESPKPVEGSTSATKKSKKVLPHVKIDLNSLNLAVGQCFDSKVALENRLKVLSVVNQFDFDVDRSTPSLLVVKCWVEGCSWKVRATPIGDSPQFTVRIFVDAHTCSITDRSARCRQATPAILAQLYIDFIGGVDKTVLPKHVAHSLNLNFGVKVDYWKAHRTLEHARKLVMGSSEDGYAELPSYLYRIRKANPGTLTRLEVDESSRFKYLFLAFGASISGFPFMRKVVVVDGTFLQGKYKGTLLIAAAQDGNFQIFPLAFAVVDTENDESWKWFFKQLKCVIPDDDGLAIISDRHKSIGNAIGEVYPLATRGICTYHLYKNILGRLGGRDMFGLVKRAANSFILSDFESTFESIKTLNPSLHGYLEKAGVQLWSRVHFPGDRYNLTTSNIAESLNNVLAEARSMPIVRLIEAIRLMMTRWFATRKHDAGKMKTILTRGVEKLLEKRVAYAKTLNVQAIDADQSQVAGVTSLHVVNLRERKCSCRRFDVEKIPCAHAIAAAEARKISRISLSHPYFKTEYLFNSWKSSVMPKDTSSPLPDEVLKKTCLPPNVRQPPGRPKNTRIRSWFDKEPAKKKPRKEHTCSKCNKTGHNCKTCDFV